MSNIKVQLYLTKELAKMLSKYATKRGCNNSEFFRYLIYEYHLQHEDDK